LGFKRYYGIDFKEYQKMHDDQNGLCAICGNPETAVHDGKARSLAVDHDHETGEVRQLLCRACNSGIGHLNDDMNRVEAAFLYLKRHQATKVIYNSLFAMQNGCCAICGNPEYPPVNDKRHKLIFDKTNDGLPRGLLCDSCKEGLASVDYDPERLERLAAYVEKSRPANDAGNVVTLPVKETI
jgi:hypothetical protein